MLQSPDDDGQAEPFFITEQIETEMRAAGYAFEPPLRIRIGPIGQQAGNTRAELEWSRFSG